MQPPDLDSDVVLELARPVADGHTKAQLEAMAAARRVPLTGDELKLDIARLIVVADAALEPDEAVDDQAEGAVYVVTSDRFAGGARGDELTAAQVVEFAPVEFLVNANQITPKE